MRRLVMTGAALAALLPAGVASATTPPGPTDPPPTPRRRRRTPPRRHRTTRASPRPCSTTPATPSPRSPSPAAKSAGPTTRRATTPKPETSTCRCAVTVESEITEGTFGISVDDFILQSNNGFVTDAETIASAAQAEDEEEITDEADLANGESVDLC